MSTISNLNKVVRKVIKKYPYIFFDENNTPTFKVVIPTKTVYPVLTNIQKTSNISLFIFLLGIKTHNTYHLNTVVFYTQKNIITRFEPLSTNEFSNEVNTLIKNYLCSELSKIFKITNPLFIVVHGRQTHNPNCVQLCEKYILNLLRKWSLEN